MEKEKKHTKIDSWMKKLGLHYETMRALYPGERLMIMFDIDGTIIDMRHMVLHALKKYDRINKADHFSGIELEDICVDENTVGRLLIEFKIPADVRKHFLEWYAEYRTSHKAIMESHKPFRGVMEIIRWFQDQPDTYVSLNTGRPESIRKSTLKLLNKIGKEYGVRFSNKMLFMNPYDWNTKCTGIKAEGVRKYREKGYRIFAFIDNEPENLLSVSRSEKNNELLLLHASTIYKSSSDMLPDSAISGDVYDIDDIVYY
jgi:hypothetical protein